MSLDVAKKWFANLCSALDQAHSKLVIHRDIKPSNLIITQNGESCYIVDFGIALLKTEIERLTNGSPIGTAGYMSPEQENNEELGPESDIYSLGVVLYECLASSRPRIGEYRPLNTLNESIPPTIDNLIKSCLEERNHRLSSTMEFFKKLEKTLQPHGDFSETLLSGSLHEIQLAIGKMSPSDFANLPAGQRRLVLSRMQDLTQINEPHLRNAIASLLGELVRVGYCIPKQTNYCFYIKYGLIYGYEMSYDKNWKGNAQLREALNEVAAQIIGEAHGIISTETLSFMKEISDLEKKEKWYLHDLRILLQNLLANPNTT